VRFVFKGKVFEWRGPAPFYFVATPEAISEQIEELKSELTYGWGVIPAKITIGKITVSTSLIPKDGVFYVPLKLDIRKPNSIELGDVVQIAIQL
jgi:hypothetical protein